MAKASQIKFEFVTDKNGEKRLYTYKDGKYFCDFGTSEDEEGHVYGYVPNINVVDDKKIHKRRLTIKEKVEQIRNGYGDAICVSNFMFRSEHLVYFEDRFYGELMRYKSIQGFKDTQFGYCITMWHPIETRAVGKDSCTCRVHDAKNLLVFDTKEQAQEYINEAMVTAEKLYNEYIKIDSGDKDKKWKFLDNVYSYNLATSSAFDNYCDFNRKSEDGYIDPSRFFGITDCIKI